MDEMENLSEADFAPTAITPKAPYLTITEARSGNWHIIAHMRNFATTPPTEGEGEFFISAPSRSTALHLLRQIAARRGIKIGVVAFVEDTHSVGYARELAHFARGGKKGTSSWERAHG